MAQTGETISDPAASRYRAMVAGLLRDSGSKLPPLTAGSPVTLRAAVAVTSGDAGATCRRALAESDPSAAFADAGGDRRAVYFGLVLATLGGASDGGDADALAGWSAVARRTVAAVDLVGVAAGAGFPSADDARVAAAAWAAVGLGAAARLTGDVTASDESAAVIARVVAAQRPSGSYLSTAAGVANLESLWYHDLALTHAVMSHAGRSGDPAARDSALRAAAYHLDETQPDHATGQPWGLPAFIASPYARPLADSVLHAAAMSAAAAGGTGGLGAVNVLLLADTLAALGPVAD